MTSTVEAFRQRMDPTPRPRRRYGPFAFGETKTVADLLKFCEDNGLDPSEVRVAHNHCRWDDHESPEEVARRVQGAEVDLERHLDWFRRSHAEYVTEGLIKP